MTWGYSKKIFASLLSVIFLWGCAAGGDADERGVAGPAVTVPVVSWDGRGLENFAPVVDSLGEPGSLEMALSGCDCAAKKVAELLTTGATGRGVLPQFIVPQIRESITSNSKLKLLSKLPPLLGDALKGMFATDEKLAKEVRDGIGEKLEKSLAGLGGTTLSKRTPFRFDLFTPRPSQTNSFDMASQALRWNLVMGRKSLWSTNVPLDGVDHGLQLLETMRIMAEWAYIGGIGDGGKPNGFGGLALDVRSGARKVAAPYDLANAPAGAGLFVSGSFTISYPNAASVDMATSVKESWSFAADDVPLLTQARVWLSAGLALQNLRLDRPGNARSILGHSGGALSKDIQQLPLMWLPGLGELLKQQFVNRDLRVIKKTGYGSQDFADLETLITLGDALHQWRIAVSNISVNNFSPAVYQKLKDVPEQLLVPLQFVVQKILSEHTFVQDQGDVKLLVGSRGQPTNTRLSAMTIRLLAALEQEALTSVELKTKVLSLMSSHAAIWAKSNAKLDAATIIEQYRAASTIAKYPGGQPWITQLRDRLAAGVSAWGGT